MSILTIRCCTLVMLFALLMGCSQFFPDLPEWVENLPEDEQSYYAVGMGVDAYNAEIDARVSMAAQFSVLVNDNTSIYSYSDKQFSQAFIEVLSSVDVVDVNLNKPELLSSKPLKANILYC